MADSIFDIHDKVKAQFQHVGEVGKNLSGVSNILDGLVKLGDVVTEDDVVKAAGKIVGKGLLAANAMAGILAGMPENGGGEALAGWIAQHDQEIKQQQMQVEQLHEAVGHQLAVSAHHVIGEALGGPMVEAPDANALGAMP